MTAVFLVDTNVVSEARKGSRANPGVQRFLRTVEPDFLYLAVQTVGEFRHGIERIRLRGDIPQSDLLEAWLQHVTADYADRILVFDAECAQVWGKLLASHNQHPVDKQIAAIALVHGLTVATRNTGDFASTGVALLNPFE